MSVDSDGKLFLDKDEIDAGMLEARLATIKSADSETRVRLQADTAVNYGAVAKAMASIERAGITRVAVVTAR